MNLKHGRLSAILFCLALSVSCSSKQTVPTVYSEASTFDAQAKMVVVVSFDGLRPDAIQAAGADHILSLVAAGTQAVAAHTIMPSITLPSHSSMVSGVSPAKHGILWNDWSPARGLIPVTTMFEEAKHAGFTTAMVANKEKFKHLNRPGTIDEVVLEYGDPKELADAASSVIRRVRPHLLFVHFGHPDKAGHDDGWMSKSQLEVIDDADQALGTIFHTIKDLGLQASTTIILTADHGGSGKGHGDASEVSTSIPWIAAGAGVPVRGKLQKSLMTYDTAATAITLLGVPVPASWDGVSAF